MTATRPAAPVGRRGGLGGKPTDPPASGRDLRTKPFLAPCQSRARTACRHLAGDAVERKSHGELGRLAPSRASGSVVAGSDGSRSHGRTCISPAPAARHATRGLQRTRYRRSRACTRQARSWRDAGRCGKTGRHLLRRCDPCAADCESCCQSSSASRLGWARARGRVVRRDRSRLGGRAFGVPLTFDGFGSPFGGTRLAQWALWT